MYGTWWQMKIVSRKFILRCHRPPPISCRRRNKNSLSLIYLLKSKWQCHETFSAQNSAIVFLICSYYLLFRSSFCAAKWWVVVGPQVFGLPFSNVALSTHKKSVWQIVYFICRLNWKAKKFNETFYHFWVYSLIYTPTCKQNLQSGWKSIKFERIDAKTKRMTRRISPLLTIYRLKIVIYKSDWKHF